MKNNQRGFAHLMVVIVLLLIGVIGLVGWRVYGTNKDKNTPQNSTESHAASKDIPLTTNADSPTTEFTLITTDRLVLGEWNIAMTLPKGLVGKAVYKRALPIPENQEYVFATELMTKSTTCADYFGSDLYKQSEIGMGLHRYPTSLRALYQFGDQAKPNETLGEYFDRHKVANENYFQDTDRWDAKWYKVGDYLFLLELFPGDVSQSEKDKFTASCGGESYDYRDGFIDMISTIEAN